MLVDRGSKRAVSPRRTLAIVLASAVIACTPPAPPNVTLRTLIDTERDFSRAAATYGMKVAFLRYLDDDAIVFRPHPVNGQQYTSQRPDPGIELSWEPVRAGVAAAGDLGWTTGPYRVASPDGADDLLGYFVSVWKLQTTGRWKVVIDLGTENPPGEACAEEAMLEPSPAGRSRTASAADADTLRRLELELSEGSSSALATVLGDEPRFYRDGECPTVGREQVVALLAESPVDLGWETIAVHVSDSGDLAYSYGSHDRGYYVRIWERPSDDWQLILEVSSPVPSESGEEAEAASDDE